MLKPHTGKRKRSRSRGEIEAMSKRRRGTTRERAMARELYDPRGQSTLCSIEDCDLEVGTVCSMTGCPGRYV
jgi:hypothetical protein